MKRSIAAAAAIAAGLVLTATTGAVAGGLITSHNIQDNTIKSRDLADSKAVGERDLRPDLAAKINQQPTQGSDQPVKYLQALGDGLHAVDPTGLKMTGEGVQFGPFVNGGGCDTAGTDYARLQVIGAAPGPILNGMALGDLTGLDYTGWTTSDDNTSGVGSLTLRLTTDGGNRFVFSPNTQPGADRNADTRNVVKTYLTTVGTWRVNDDAGEGQDSPWKTIIQGHENEHISKADILLGCQAGQHLTGVVTSFEVNGFTYQIGKIG